MTDYQWKWAIIENICWIALIGFLCWVLNSGWPCLLVIGLNSPKYRPKPEAEPRCEYTTSQGRCTLCADHANDHHVGPH